MSFYLSTSCFGNTFLENAILDCLNVSCSSIEISAPHFFQPYEIYEKILSHYKDKGCNFTVHNYFPTPSEPFVLNIASRDENQIKNASNLISKALELCTFLGSPFYGVHAGYLSEGVDLKEGSFRFSKITPDSYSLALNSAIEFINNIFPRFQKAGVKLLIENLFPSQHENHSLFCSMEQIKELADQIPNEVGLILDLGHINVSSNLMGFDRSKAIDDYMNNFNDRLFEVHISENNGFKDDHFALKENSWQLDTLKKLFKIKAPRRLIPYTAWRSDVLLYLKFVKMWIS